MVQGGHGRLSVEDDVPIQMMTEYVSPSPSSDPCDHLKHAMQRRRPQVIARLLGRGISTATLFTLLPEWRELIDHADQERSSTS